MGSDMRPRHVTRRRFLAGTAALAASAALPTRRAFAVEPEESDTSGDVKHTALGIGIASYGFHSRKYRAEGFRAPLNFLEFCHARGAGGVQVPIQASDADDAMKIRARAEAWGMYVEGTIRMPRDAQDIERFDADVRASREAGATVLRTVLFSGRRYEVFDSAEDTVGRCVFLR